MNRRLPPAANSSMLPADGLSPASVERACPSSVMPKVRMGALAASVFFSLTAGAEVIRMLKGGRFEINDSSVRRLQPKGVEKD